jgi:hypothetical protein
LSEKLPGLSLFRGTALSAEAHLPIDGSGAAFRAAGAGRQPSLKLRQGTRLRYGIAELAASPSIGRCTLSAAFPISGLAKVISSYLDIKIYPV